MGSCQGPGRGRTRSGRVIPLEDPKPGNFGALFLRHVATLSASGC